VTTPRILSFDIETAGINAFKADLGFVILFGYKWSDEEEAHVITLDKEGLRNFDDRRLLKRASQLFADADLVVGHFAAPFDRRFLNGRLLIHGLSPLPPTRLRDTCLIARSIGTFSSNRLKHLANLLKLRHRKLENDWPRAWFQVLQGNREALRKLGEYCKGDVLAVEELYFKLRPFDNPHPRIYPHDEKPRCGACGAELMLRGFTYAGQYLYQRYQCKACGKWDRSRNAARVVTSAVEAVESDCGRGRGSRRLRQSTRSRSDAPRKIRRLRSERRGSEERA
jgi:hypothetical protein